MQLENKVAVVTGSSAGIGKAIALAFAAEGAAVAVNYARNAEGAEEVVEKIEGDGGRALAVQADVSKPEDVRSLIQHAVQEFGRLDVMVNNAGTSTRCPSSRRRWRSGRRSSLST